MQSVFKPSYILTRNMP